MARKNLNNIKLGVFILAAFILFTYGLYRIGDRQSFLSNYLTLYVDFKDVKGLRPGNNVRYSGITIGSVEEINILNDTTLRVRLEVEQRAVQYLRKNAQAEVGSSGLVGNMLVNIKPGPGKAELVSPGDILKTNPSVEMNDMVDLLAVSNNRIEQITHQLLQITEKMNQGQGSISMLLNDQQMATHLGQSMQQMAATSQSLNFASQDLAELMAQANSGSGNLGYLVRDTSLKSQITRLGGHLDTLVTLRTQPVLDSIETLASSLTETSRLVNNLINDLDTLFVDSSVTRDLQATLHNLEQGTYKFDQNMEALQYSWPFRKFFRKKARKNK
ncbi:MAG TPA: MlaD family protein [Saprospiraceae bacterium]|nr:MlaD family protein [Saprospiraceae bacterium]